MTAVVVHPSLELQAAELHGHRPDLPVISPPEPAAVPSAIRTADGPVSFLCANREWDDAYLPPLTEGDWVATIGTGYDRYPVERFADAGIAFTNSPGVNAPQVAEHAMALALACTRRLRRYVDQERDHAWQRRQHDLSDLCGDRCCVVGLGNIGEAVARRADAFGMTVVGTKRRVDDYDGVAATVYETADLASALAGARLVVVAVPLTEATRGLLDATAFAACVDDAILVNVARGAVIETDALLAALDTGDLGFAGLDVVETEPLPDDHPLWEHERVFLTPHVGGASDKYADRFIEMYLDAYDDWCRGVDLEHSIA